MTLLREFVGLIPVISRLTAINKCGKTLLRDELETKMMLSGALSTLQSLLQSFGIPRAASCLPKTLPP
jgi:hypothetical protein